MVMTMTMKEYARQYYREKYGSICDELEMVLGWIGESDDLSEEEMLNIVEWTFACEWDCGIDEWYVVFINSEMTQKEYYEKYELG